MFITTLRTLAVDAVDATRRFPLPVLCSLLFCSVSIYRLDSSDASERYLTILFIGCFWFIAAQLFHEGSGIAKTRIYGIATLLFAAFAWIIYTSIGVTAHMLFLGSAAFLTMFVAPFIWCTHSNLDLWSYNKRLWLHIGFTTLVAIVLFAGLAGITLSIEYLFGFDFYSDFRTDLWLVVATFFAPVLAMSGIPRAFTTPDQHYPKAARLIFGYVVLPLGFICGAVLYAYIAKIIIFWELPKGQVAQLVMSFGCLGMLAYLAIYPMRQQPGIFRLFANLYPKLILAPLMLLAIGIGVRLAQYGFTESRYAILLCLIWLTFCALAILRKDREPPLKWILCIVPLLFILASFGPWGAVNVTIANQLHRLEAVLVKNQILVNGRIHKAQSSVDKEDLVAISAGLDYFAQRDKIGLIQPWFQDMPNAYIYSREPYQYYNTNAIAKDMGIEYVGRYDRSFEQRVAQDKFFSFDARNNDGVYEPLQVTGYDVLVLPPGYINERNPRTLRLPDNSQLTTSVDAEEHYVVTIGNHEPLRFDLRALLKALQARKSTGQVVNLEEFTLEKSSGSYGAKLHIQSISGSYSDGGEMDVTSINTTLLIKKLATP
jgi:hypothetical protein